MVSAPGHFPPLVERAAAASQEPSGRPWGSEVSLGKQSRVERGRQSRNPCGQRCGERLDISVGVCDPWGPAHQWSSQLPWTWSCRSSPSSCPYFIISFWVKDSPRLCLEKSWQRTFYLLPGTLGTGGSQRPVLGSGNVQSLISNVCCGCQMRVATGVCRRDSPVQEVSGFFLVLAGSPGQVASPVAPALGSSC